MDEIDAQLLRMNQAGEIERWLEQSEVIYRDMVNLPADSR
jgi:polar amino acid transport system substrate-binding protein